MLCQHICSKEEFNRVGYLNLIVLDYTNRDYRYLKVYAIIVINGFCRLKLVKDHTVGDLPAALPAVSPLKYLFFWYL